MRPCKVSRPMSAQRMFETVLLSRNQLSAELENGTRQRPLQSIVRGSLCSICPGGQAWKVKRDHSGVVAKGLLTPHADPPAGWWAHLVGAHRVHPHKH